MNNSNSDKNNNKKIDDRRKIEACIGKVGELYTFLGISKTSTTEEIADKYLKMRNRLGIKENDNEINNLKMDELRKHLYESSLLSFNVLSNPNTRSLYDKEYFEIASSLSENDDDSNNNNNNNNNNNKKIKNLFIYQLLSTVLDLILVNTSKKGDQSIIKIIETIYRRNGSTSFFIGGVYNLCGDIIHSISISYPINSIISHLFKNHKQIMITSETISRTITYYPIKFIIDCIFLSPFITSPIKVINNIILRNNNNNNNKFQISNLFYSFSSSILILLIRKLIDISMIRIEKLILEKVNKNKNQDQESFSNFWNYCEKIYCNSITQGLLRASLLHPLQIIRLQYPYEFVESYLQGTPIPRVIDPISMAIKVYNQQGFSKFYNGFSIAIPFYILQSISTRINPPNNLNLYSGI
ncbi:hypothetical protein ACTFIV_004627 [Dictyostelium citrinum]